LIYKIQTLLPPILNHYQYATICQLEDFLNNGGIVLVQEISE